MRRPVPSLRWLLAEHENKIIHSENGELVTEDTGAFRADLDRWLDAHAGELAPAFEGRGTLDEQMAQLAKVKRSCFDAGWMQHGWPERVGGSGGSPLLRAIVGEAITERDLVVPGYFSMIEVLAPTVIDFATPELAATVVPRLLRGDEMWCQGFSEPGTGSDLASLACRASYDADREAWIVNGQKVWTSLSQYSARCVLLTRTGDPESRHRGITAFFVDMDTPGITTRPLRTMAGVDEFSEVFLDDVCVPGERLLGEVDGGWAVAMALLPFERSTAFWHRVAFLLSRLRNLVEAVDDDSHTHALVGEVFQEIYGLRARSRLTQHRLAAGESLGAETSVDKVLVATAEQALFDTARDLLGGTVELDDTPTGEVWRTDYLYSRAATIYGGTAEIQRNIIARRLLDLGAEA